MTNLQIMKSIEDAVSEIKKAQLELCRNNCSQTIYNLTYDAIQHLEAQQRELIALEY